MTHDTPASFAIQGFGAPFQHTLLAQKEQLIQHTSLRISQQMLQASLEAEVTAELGGHHAVRLDGYSVWRCRRCQAQSPRMFRRNGHYLRSVTVREGTVVVRMPLIRCRCRGYVDVPWQTIDARARYWLDIQLDGIRHYLAGMSYRLTGDAASDAAQTNISHVEAWRTMQAVGMQTKKDTATLGPCPRSVILDEAYISVDGRKLVYLIAVADDGRVLAVWGPTGRTLESWQTVLEWLSDHGITPLSGLVGVTYDGDSAIRGAVHLVWPRVVLQQCIWHLLARVADDVAAVHGPKATEVDRIVDQAARIFLRDPEQSDADSRARLRWTEFVAEHGGMAWSETVSRAFEEATEYLRTPGLQRTNGAAERMIKELRRRTRSMDGFKSEDGAAHFAVVWRIWKNMRLAMNRQRSRQMRRQRRNLKIPQPYPKLA